MNLEIDGCFLPGSGSLPKLIETPQGKVSKKAEELPHPTWKARKRIFMVPVASQKKHRMQNGRHEFWDDQVTSS